MKRYFFLIVLISCLYSCQLSIEKTEISEFPLRQEIRPSVVLTEPVILYPDAMFIMNDQMWVFQGKKDTIFDVFDIQTCKYLFSTGTKGRGPEDFLSPVGQTIQAENVFFTILDHNNLKTVVWQPDFGLHTVSVQKTFDLSPINGFIKLNDTLFCAFADCATRSTSDFEFQLKNIHDNSIIKFSTYPEYLAKRKFDQETRCQIYYKYLVANPVKRKFAAFYSRYKVFRLFSYEGILEKEIHVNIPPFQIRDVENSEKRIFFYARVVSTDQYIYAYCASNKEIQVWDWDGNPIIVYSLDRDYFRFTVSEEHKKIYLTSIEEMDLNKFFVFDMLHIEPQ